MDPLPSLNYAFSMIIQYERQSNPSFDEETIVFIITTNNRKNFGGGKGNNNWRHVS